MMSEIHHSGTLELVARSEAERYGAQAKIRPSRASEREGTIAVSKGERHTAIPYGLPEDEDDIRRTIRGVIRGDEIESQRRRGDTSPVVGV